MDSIERIEGGKYADTILGSMGNDTIHSGDGGDVITGNKGDDLLAGGPGRDVYVYAQGDGHDTIIDSGDNQIQLRLADGSIVPVGDFFAKDASTWESADGRMRLVHDATWKILMPSGGFIDLGVDFAEGDHGIRLINPTPTALTLTGSANRDEMGFVTYGSNPANWDLYFASFPPNESSTSLFQQQLPSTAPRMYITGGASGDYLFGFQSRDEIHGGDGGDILTGNTRAWRGTALNMDGPLEGDHLDGGAGGDFMTGSGGADQIFGDDGDDFLDGLNDNDLLDGGTGADVLSGGSGSDILLGGEGDDILTGDGYLQLNTKLSLDNLHQFGVTVTPSAEGYHTGFNTAWLMCTGHQLPL